MRPIRNRAASSDTVSACYEDQEEQRPLALKIGPLGTVIGTLVTGIQMSVEICLADLFQSRRTTRPSK